MSSYTVPLYPFHRPPLTLNKRLHWAAERTIRRDLGLLVVNRARNIPKLPRIHVTLHWQPAMHRRRDTDNPAPTLKACIDALVKAGVVPDDDSSRVSSATVIHDVATVPKLWLEVQPK